MACIRAILVFAAFSLTSAAPLQDDGLPRGLRFENQTWVQEQLKANEKHMADWKTNGDVNSVSSGEMFVPVCYQNCDEWCWATAVSMTVDYYKGMSECQGLECQMPSREFGLQCCPYTNSCTSSPNAPESSCNTAGTAQQMADAAGAFTGGPFSSSGPLSQTELDSALNSGRPVMIGVIWQGENSGHALIIGGVKNFDYLVHDPWGWYSNMPPQWQQLSFGQLLEYNAPNGGIGKWTFSVMWSMSDEVGHQMAIQRLAQVNRTSAVIV